MIKQNQPVLRQALVEWVEEQLERGKGQRWQQNAKGHGRIEQREVWLVPCEEEIQAYLAQQFGWGGVQWCGYIWRRRRRLHMKTWEEEKQHVWVAGAAFPWALEAATAASFLRTHWHIENRIFYVRDVTQNEDRGHARAIALALSGLRCLALTVLRLLVPAPYIPDARRLVSAMPDEGMALLTTPL